MSDYTIQDATRRLSGLLQEQSAAQERVQAIQDDIDAVRQQVQAAMVEGEYKSHESNGLKVSIRTKKYPQVTDADALRAHIVSMEIEPEYIVSRFDQVKARNDAAKNGWPGVEVEVREELVVKAAAR